MASVRSVLLMLVAPPLVLLFWAHFIRSSWPGLDWPVVILAGLLGLVGIATSPWERRAKVSFGIVYLGLALAALPFLSLLAVCSTGDCL